jgi:hypothetical protein
MKGECQISAEYDAMARARIERGSYRKLLRERQQGIGVDHPPQVLLSFIEN